MANYRSLALIFLFSAGMPACGSDAAPTSGGTGPKASDWVPDYFPTAEWRTRAPEAMGYDAGALEAAVSFAAASPTQGLVIIQDGYIVAERYFLGFGADQSHESFSMAKSFTSALVGIAIEEQLLTGVEEQLCNFYSEWSCDDTADDRGKIALSHVMSLSSGLEWNEAWEPGADLSRNDAIRMSTSGRPIDYVLAKPSVHPPGTYFQYSTGDPALVSGVLQGATGKTALEYAREKIFTVIGAASIEWNSDADGRTTTFAGLSATVLDYARFGFLYMNRGRWEGAQVVPASWVDLSTRPGVSLEHWYGYLWHVNLPSRFADPELPPDGYTAQGVSGQFVTVIPSERLVVVRVANDGIGAAEFDLAGLLKRILTAKRGG